MSNNIDKQKNYGINSEKATIDVRTYPSNTQEAQNYLENKQANLFKSKLEFFAKNIIFHYKPEYSLQVDARKFLLRSLLLLLAEYMIYFAFQLIGYFPLEGFWRDSKYIPGIILGVVYGVLVILLVVLSRMKHKMLLYLLKILEFLTAFFLLGYLAAWDFGTVSLSYMMIIDIFVILIFVI